jgi:hypothetical protein
LNRKCIAGAEAEDSREIEKTSAASDPRSPEVAPVEGPPGQSWGNAVRIAEIEAAIGNLTRLLGKTDDPEPAAALVAERRAMREELAALWREGGGNVTPIDRARRPVC